MKIVKVNLWNLLFQSKKILFQERERCRHQHIIDVADYIISWLEEAKDLKSIFFIHKILWGTGLRNRNIGPNAHGIFRTKEIKNMKMEEVFLGNILGLFTFPIPYWERMKESRQACGANGFGIDPGIPVYNIIVEQYRELLISNVKDIKMDAQAFMKEYQKSLKT